MNKVNPYQNRFEFSLVTYLLVFSLMGILILFMDVFLDSIIISQHNFMWVINRELQNGEIITDRLWFIIFPLFAIALWSVTQLQNRDLTTLEEKIMKIIESSPNLIVLHNGTNVLSVNESFLHTLNYNSNDVSDLTLSKFFPEYESYYSINAGEFTWQTSNGTEILVEVISSDILKQGTTLTIAQTHDKVEEKKMSSKKYESQIMLEDRKDLVREMISGIGHDFGNLLQIMKIYSEQLEAQENQNGNMRDIVEKLGQTVRRANELAIELRTMTQNFEVRRVDVKIHILLTELVSVLEKMLPGNIILNYTGDHEVVVEIDELQIYNSFLNLLINAVDAMPHGGTIEIVTQRVIFNQEDLVMKGFPIKQGGYLLISVSDEGTGIPIEIKDRIFDPFFTTKAKGTGLGLSRVYSTIRAHNGWIDVNTSKEIGATFLVYLPLKVIKI